MQDKMIDASYMAIPGIDKTESPKKMAINLNLINEIAVEVLNVPEGSLTKKTNRKPEYVRPRQIAMHISWINTKFTLKEIGNYFGGYDHATVHHAYKTICDLSDTDKEIKNQVEEIEKQLKTMTDLFNQTEFGATFSECRKYRYALWRIWDKSKPLIMFVGLNPSTANEYKEDPTIRKVKKYSIQLGYGGFYMMNLFAFISSHPEDLETCQDPIADNDKWLLEIFPKCQTIVFAWGTFKQAIERGKKLSKMFPDAKALKINDDGSPIHPLWAPEVSELIKYGK